MFSVFWRCEDWPSLLGEQSPLLCWPERKRPQWLTLHIGFLEFPCFVWKIFSLYPLSWKLQSSPEPCTSSLLPLCWPCPGASKWASPVRLCLILVILSTDFHLLPASPVGVIRLASPPAPATSMIHTGVTTHQAALTYLPIPASLLEQKPTALDPSLLNS